MMSVFFEPHVNPRIIINIYEPLAEIMSPNDWG